MRSGNGVKTLGIVGFVAKGVALLILGVLLLVAAVRGRSVGRGRVGCRDRRAARGAVRTLARRSHRRGAHHLRSLLRVSREVRGSVARGIRPVNALCDAQPVAQARRMTENTPEEVTGAEAMARIKELVEDIDFTMLTTQDAAGNLVSRPMSTRQMDDSGDIWFFTLRRLQEGRRGAGRSRREPRLRRLEGLPVRHGRRARAGRARPRQDGGALHVVARRSGSKTDSRRRASRFCG